MKIKTLLTGCVVFLLGSGLLLGSGFLFAACTVDSFRYFVKDFHFTSHNGQGLFPEQKGDQELDTRLILHTGTIKGTILDSDGKPLCGVIIFAKFGNKERVEMTDSLGCYSLASPPGGPYVLTVKRSGFNTLEEPGIFVEEKKHKIVNFVMKQKLSKEPVFYAGTLRAHL